MLCINQNIRQNLADLLTKFNLKEDDPELWIEYQNRLLTGDWLAVQHPRNWTMEVIKESEEMMRIAKVGYQISNSQTSSPAVEKDILKIENNFVSITDETNILMKHYPQ